MSAYTPGPWRIANTESALLQINDQDRRSVAQVWDWPEMQANAALIAAAPELVEALQAFEAWIQSADYGMPAEHRLDKARELSRAALAKAGVTP